VPQEQERPASEGGPYFLGGCKVAIRENGVPGLGDLKVAATVLRRIGRLC
jgi:hypothetical protein